MSYGFGIIGTGMISGFHARAIQAMNGGNLLACFSRSKEKATKFAGQYDCTGYENLDSFLSHPGLDIITICTPSGAHLEYALKCAEAGKHAVIEKPLEITLERCDRIIEAYEKKNLQLGGVFQSRFFDASRILKEAVDKGRFGKLVLGDAYVKWYRNQEYYDTGGWKGTKALDGGGALMNQSIHAIDLLQWFMGPVDSVAAFACTLGHERIEVEDTAVAALQFENGALGVIEGSTAAYPGFLKRIEISGTMGSAVLEEDHFNEWSFVDENENDREIKVDFGKKSETGGGASDPSAIDFSGHKKQFENFVKALDKKEQLLVDGVEARKSVQIILSIYESASKQKLIKLK
ncbi:MAG: gfo/Idh/MocA family oxidoreductase [Spirochaetes bacterium]|nr:MAG: gfo/Idh/MocA family oxidoreductase [Spirochaetota bacterium]